MLTHSHSGQFGFPEGERPDDIPAKAQFVDEAMQPQMVPPDDFLKLTKFPIIIIYGDNISKEPSDIFNVDLWRVAGKRAIQFVEAINRHGGNAQIVFLSEIGIYGNTHAAFADLNNLDIAAHLESWLHDRGLDGRDKPHQGPNRTQIAQYTFPIELNKEESEE